MILKATQTGAESTKDVLSGIKVNTSKVFAGKSEYEEPEETINIYIGVFFDGTANNKDNTNSRLAYEKKERGEKLTDKEEEAAEAYEGWLWGTKGGSFENDLSNIAKMEAFYEEKGEEKFAQTRVYIEGAGTQNGKSDSKIGLGLGKGGTGVRAKVLKGCKEAAEKIKEATNGKEINKLIIDVFGFSRGAGEARNFVHEITQKEGDVEKTIRGRDFKFHQDHGILGKELVKQGVEEIAIWDIRFAGLFDTVLSVGIGFHQHKDNVKKLKMIAVNKARFVFQLAAADEHRNNFKLTNINSATGLEKTLPGVHSDIGGGYVHNSPDEVTLKRSSYIKSIEKEQAYLIAQGWYKDGEIPIKTHYQGKFSTNYSLEGNKKSVSNEYSFIPMHIMSEMMVKKKIDFLENDVIAKYPIPGDLTKAKEEIDKYVKGERGKLTLETDEVLIKKLRNKYFHWSANLASIGMSPSIKGGVRTRTIFSG